MSRTTAIGAALGIAWALVALSVYVGMRKGLLPGPSQYPEPIGPAIIALYAPFIAAIGVEAGMRRTSPGFGEVILLTLLIGALAGTTLASLSVRIVRMVSLIIARRA